MILEPHDLALLKQLRQMQREAASRSHGRDAQAQARAELKICEQQVVNACLTGLALELPREVEFLGATVESPGATVLHFHDCSDPEAKRRFTVPLTELIAVALTLSRSAQ